MVQSVAITTPQISLNLRVETKYSSTSCWYIGRLRPSAAEIFCLPLYMTVRENVDQAAAAA